MEASPLAKLPAELRNHIYELALSGSPLRIIAGGSGVPRLYKYDASRRSLALARTCKAVYHDTINMIYGNNTFEFLGRQQSTAGLKCLLDFARIIGTSNTEALRSLRLKFAGYQAANHDPQLGYLHGFWQKLIPDLQQSLEAIQHHQWGAFSHCKITLQFHVLFTIGKWARAKIDPEVNVRELHNAWSQIYDNLHGHRLATSEEVAPLLEAKLQEFLEIRPRFEGMLREFRGWWPSEEPQVDSAGQSSVDRPGTTQECTLSLRGCDYEKQQLCLASDHTLFVDDAAGDTRLNDTTAKANDGG